MNETTVITKVKTPGKYSVGDLFKIDDELAILVAVGNCYTIVSITDGVEFEGGSIDASAILSCDVPSSIIDPILSRGWVVEYLGPCRITATVA